MTTDSNSSATSPPRKGESLPTVLRQRLVASLDEATRRGARRAGLMLASSLVAVTTYGSRIAVAQEGGGGGGDISGLVCGTGAGNAITLVFGVMALAFTALGIAQGALAVNSYKGSSQGSQSASKSKGVSAAGSFGAVFLLAAGPEILNFIGLSTFDCVSFLPV